MKKNILIGVTGSIAAYKMPDLAHKFIKLGFDVQVMMTKNATEFIPAYTFETLTQKKCLVDTFDKNFEYSVEHISAAKAADVVLIAPASANVIGKLANGIADDMLTTTVLAATCPKIISPAMNHNMWHNPVVQDNIKKLENYGWIIVPPESGTLANGDVGDGRMPSLEVLKQYVLREIKQEHIFKGKKILVTAGATKEAIDPVRYITNHSSGKMGIALCRSAIEKGADVTLIHASISVPVPLFVKEIAVNSANDLYEAVTKNSGDFDIIFMAAAVADYTPKEVSKQKIKKSEDIARIELKKTKDILYELGKNKKDGQFLCGFSMETSNLIENSSKKLSKKNADMICANNLYVEGAGFKTDTNVITIITKTDAKQLPKMSKDLCADAILDKIYSLIK